MTNTHILVVDDEPQLLRTLRTSLSVAGHNVLTAGTAAEFFPILRREQVDVVVLDLGLPDADGKDVIADVRQFSDVPIIVLSARDMEQVRWRNAARIFPPGALPGIPYGEREPQRTGARTAEAR